MPNNQNTNVVETERLRLERFAPHHAPALLAYFDRNRAHLEPWEPARAPDFYTLPHWDAACESAMAGADRGEFVRFAVFERGGEEVVGVFNLWHIRRLVIFSAILGYSIDARQQGRGYATEAGGAVVRYAFDVLGLHRVEAAYQPANERSGRVLRRLGFVVEGYARDLLNFGNGWLDHIMTSRINENWQPPPGYDSVGRD